MGPMPESKTENCRCVHGNSRAAYTEFAFRQPFPFGFVKKLTARTVHHARKLEVWAATEDKKIREVPGIIYDSKPRDMKNTAIEKTLRSLSRIAEWSAMCVSPSFGFKFDAEKYPDVYEPAEDSFLLADAVLDEINGCDSVLEIGCGSGIISYLIKKEYEYSTIAIDINPHAVECARNNGIDAHESDMFKDVPGLFDIIIFNPPYLPDDMGEPDNAGIDKALYGGTTGRELIIRFLEEAKEHLFEDGKILIVISSHTGPEELKEKAKEIGYTMEKTDEFENLSTWKLEIAD